MAHEAAKGINNNSNNNNDNNNINDNDDDTYNQREREICRATKTNFILSTVS